MAYYKLRICLKDRLSLLTVHTYRTYLPACLCRVLGSTLLIKTYRLICTRDTTLAQYGENAYKQLYYRHFCCISLECFSWVSSLFNPCWSDYLSLPSSLV